VVDGSTRELATNMMVDICLGYVIRKVAAIIAKCGVRRYCIVDPACTG
jgi:hypothetical protein